MNFTNKSPKWDNVGVEPQEQLKEKGFTAGYKPPASFFNWFWNRVSNCIKEIQEKLGTVEENANYYMHPEKHEAAIIEQDETHCFVSEIEIEDWNNKISSSEKGIPNGIATLDSKGKIPSSQLNVGKSIKKEAILETANWQGEAVPYSYTLSLPEATEENIIEIIPASNITIEEYEAMIETSIVGGHQSIGSITLLAYGDKPIIDLPIVILVRGD